MTIKLIRYDAACKAIAACVKIDEAKAIRDQAIGMQAYAKQARNKEMEADCVAIRMRAIRRLDQLIEQNKGQLAKVGRPPKKGFLNNPFSKPATRAEIDIDKNLAHQARTLGRLSERQFEKAVGDARDAVTRAVRTAVRISGVDQERQSYRDRRRDDGGSWRDLKALIQSGQKYRVIYADPPWPFVGGVSPILRNAARHYDTMPIPEIKALPIWELAAKDCVLFMWATWPQLEAGLDVIKCWGFKYKTNGFDWVKTNKKSKSLFTGLGFWTRANTEPCLLATIGSPSRVAKNIHQVIMAPVGKHSEKPEEARRRIERLIDGPYLELFGRKPIDGWTVWGNEVPLAVPQREAAE